jgi:hypothetical protein
MDRILGIITWATGYRLFGSPPAEARELPPDGDDLFPEYEMMDPLAYPERDALRFGNPAATNDQIQAFVIAQKVESALAQGDLETPRRMAFTAVKLDAACFDGYQMMLFYMKDLIEKDTVICGYREILHAMHGFYQEHFRAAEGHFFNEPSTRPFIRALASIAACAQNADRLDITTYAYEELVRLNHDDETSARELLVACYLKLIGRRKRIPETQPIRTWAHLQALLDARLGTKPLFGKDANEPMRRWARIFMAFDRNQDWRSMVRAENARSKAFMKIVLDEDSDLPFNLFNRGGFDEEVRHSALCVRDAIVDWPEFLIAVHDLVRKRSRPFTDEAMEGAPDPRTFQDARMLPTRRAGVAAALQQERAELTAGHMDRALYHGQDARNEMYYINFASGRWYVGAEFAIASNRATAAACLGHWGLVRMDSRFTLAMKPDHVRTYERMPRIIEAHFCPELLPRVERLLVEVHGLKSGTAEEWGRLAGQGIALLSLSTIILARMGRLTDEVLAQRVSVGIEDMYCPINVPPDVHPLLPWLTEDDLDPAPWGDDEEDAE